MPWGWLVYAAKARSVIVFERSGAPLTWNLWSIHSRSSTLHSSRCAARCAALSRILRAATAVAAPAVGVLRLAYVPRPYGDGRGSEDRKSTRLNSSHT